MSDGGFWEDPAKSCLLLDDLPSTLPGWGCCQCRTYNACAREICRYCTHPYCGDSYRWTEQQKMKPNEGAEALVITKVERIKQ